MTSSKLISFNELWRDKCSVWHLGTKENWCYRTLWWQALSKVTQMIRKCLTDSQRPFKTQRRLKVEKMCIDCKCLCYLAKKNIHCCQKVEMQHGQLLLYDSDDRNQWNKEATMARFGIELKNYYAVGFIVKQVSNVGIKSFVNRKVGKTRQEFIALL